jgi:hypothetical protein
MICGSGLRQAHGLKYFTKYEGKGKNHDNL